MRGYNNPKVDALLTEALATPVENPKRCQLAIEAQRIFMDDYMVIFFGMPESYISARDYVVNYNKGPDVSLIEPWKIYMKAH
jgi:peptide/nickel transport system substrate-binding protein